MARPKTWRDDERLLRERLYKSIAALPGLSTHFGTPVKRLHQLREMALLRWELDERVLLKARQEC